ncbi:MAG: M20 family metallopeptidase [Anaerolineaceae bacterium]
MALADLEQAKQVAERAVEAASSDLRAISLSIHARPELNYEEHHAHAVLTDYLAAEGFAVERGAYGLPTAFKAVTGSGSPTIAVFCEYDALPGIGHACGHNLIAISGLAVGMALKAALGEGNGTVLVLGSPAEEGGGGKIQMMERGALAGVDAAMMLHPSPGDAAWPSMIALEQVNVDYYGRNAHAGASPWAGVNALDAIVMAYTSISAMRQQMKPTDRVHGVITKGGEKANIIPDHTAAQFLIRSKTLADLEELRGKVMGCFEGAALASGCRLEVTPPGPAYADVSTNDVIAEAYCENMERFEMRMPSKAATEGLGGASTDMGNVSYVVPSIHPVFGIPVEAGVGNHTAGFTAAAATEESHRATLRASKALAMTALELYAKPEMLKKAWGGFNEK